MFACTVSLYGREIGTIRFDTENQAEAVEPSLDEFTDNDKAIINAEMLKYGNPYGHSLSLSSFAPEDLHYLLLVSEIVEGKFVEGEIGEYQLDIPEGAVT